MQASDETGSSSKAKWHGSVAAGVSMLVKVLHCASAIAIVLWCLYAGGDACTPCR